MDNVAVVGDLIEQRYRITSVLGEGATGIVVLAKDEKLQEDLIALKFLHSHLLFNRESLGRFRNEIKVTMSLNHPHILQTYGLGLHEGSLVYLKMQYLEGDNLSEVLKAKGKYSLDEAILMLRDIASALEYAHRRGVVHRDLKPENILLDREERPKIADFGLAQMIRLEARYTGYGEIVGTPYYMSPEQINSEAVDARSDLYSFGILAFELLVGSRPFEADNFIELAEKHLYCPLPNFEAPTWLQELIIKCTQKDRADRFASAAELLGILGENCKAKDSIEKSSLTELINSERFQSVEKQSRNFHYYLHKLASRHLRKSIFVATLVLLLILPQVQYTVRLRYWAAIIRVEEALGIELSPIRLLFHVPKSLRYPDGFFVNLDSYNTMRENVRPLLIAGYSPNIVNPKTGEYPMNNAIKNGRNIQLIKFLEAGADPNLIEKNGFSSLDYATRATTINQRVILQLLDAGANPNQLKPGVTPPLANLIVRGEISTARILLSHGASCEIETYLDYPLLHLAIRLGSPSFVNELLKKGTATSHRDLLGRDSLEYAKSMIELPNMKRIISIIQLHNAKAKKNSI